MPGIQSLSKSITNGIGYGCGGSNAAQSRRDDFGVIEFLIADLQTMAKARIDLLRERQKEKGAPNQPVDLKTLDIGDIVVFLHPSKSLFGDVDWVPGKVAVIHRTSDSEEDYIVVISGMSEGRLAIEGVALREVFKTP